MKVLLQFSNVQQGTVGERRCLHSLFVHHTLDCATFDLFCLCCFSRTFIPFIMALRFNSPVLVYVSHTGTYVQYVSYNLRQNSSCIAPWEWNSHIG